METQGGARIVVIPRKDNAGVPLVRERHQVERELLALVGGYSRTEQTGAWLGSDGRVYKDAAYRYEVAVNAVQDATLVERLYAWCELLRQQALYSQFLPTSTTIVHVIREAVSA